MKETKRMDVSAEEWTNIMAEMSADRWLNTVRKVLGWEELSRHTYSIRLIGEVNEK